MQERLAFFQSIKSYKTIGSYHEVFLNQGDLNLASLGFVKWPMEEYNPDIAVINFTYVRAQNVSYGVQYDAWLLFTDSFQFLPLISSQFAGVC